MKIKISKSDYKRVLLTDILPYEVPILFLTKVSIS